jgi:hypothetical protein
VQPSAQAASSSRARRRERASGGSGECIDERERAPPVHPEGPGAMLTPTLAK